MLLRGSPTAGTVGAKVAVSVFAPPTLSKYSIVTTRGSPAAPASTSSVGRLTFSAMFAVGSTATDDMFTWTGCRPFTVSRGCEATTPLASAGQPRSTRPDGVVR